MMLLDRVDSAELECGDLKAFVSLYHEADKKAAVLEEKLKRTTAVEILCGAGFSLGGILIGVAPSLFDTHPFGGSTVLITGAVFVALSTVARFFQRAK